MSALRIESRYAWMMEYVWMSVGEMKSFNGESVGRNRARSTWVGNRKDWNVIATVDSTGCGFVSTDKRNSSCPVSSVASDGSSSLCSAKSSAKVCFNTS